MELATQSVLVRAGLLVHGLLLLACAVVQWNDPDPLPWILLYAGASVVAFCDLGGRPQRNAAGVLTAVAVIWMASLTPEALRVEALLPSEVGREWMGLAFAAASTGLLLARAQRQTGTTRAAD